MEDNTKKNEDQEINKDIDSNNIPSDSIIDNNAIDDEEEKFLKKISFCVRLEKWIYDFLQIKSSVVIDFHVFL